MRDKISKKNNAKREVMGLIPVGDSDFPMSHARAILINSPVTFTFFNLSVRNPFRSPFLTVLVVFFAYCL